MFNVIPIGLIYFLVTINGNVADGWKDVNYAEDDEFPSIVSIQTVGDWMHFCSGAILAHRWVITAAHCFENHPERGASNLAVVAEVLDVRGPNNKIFNVDQLFIHSNYSRDVGYINNDLALLKLKDLVRYKGNVDYIKPSYVGRFSYTGIAVGWGEQGLLPTTGQIILDPMLKYEYVTYKSSLPGCPDDDYFICAVSSDKKNNHCVGSMGTLLLDYYEKRLLGIIANDENVCDPNVPYVFTRLYEYRYWIQHVKTL